MTNDRTCPGCGRNFTPRRKTSKYCAHACYAASRKGKKVPGGFEPGVVPANKVPVGTVRVRQRVGRGCPPRAWVKVREPNVWELRARVVYKAEHGDIPRGMVIHHVNGDAMDDRIENLQMLTKAEHIAVHRHEHAEARAKGLRRAWKRRKAEQAQEGA